MRIFVGSLLSLCLAASPVLAREQIRAVGSSTVYPFITAAAEEFGAIGKFPTPIIEATGTGGGFKLFCEGGGDAHPDINDASRAIKDGEIADCQKNKVGPIASVQIGYDGIIFAHKRTEEPPRNLSRAQIFLALARQVPVKGELKLNPYQRWSQIDATLPDAPIVVYGPPPTSGTRDAFVELVMEKSCMHMPEFVAAYADEKERKKKCSLLREDGGYIDAGEDDNVIVQKLSQDANAFGILGYSFTEENLGVIEPSLVENVAPDVAHITDGSYPLARSLFVYFKIDRLREQPGLAAFVQSFTSEAAMGSEGYMALKGLVPLPAATRQQARDSVREIVEKSAQPKP